MEENASDSAPDTTGNQQFTVGKKPTVKSKKPTRKTKNNFSVGKTTGKFRQN